MLGWPRRLSGWPSALALLALRSGTVGGAARQSGSFVEMWLQDLANLQPAEELLGVGVPTPADHVEFIYSARRAPAPSKVLL